MNSTQILPGTITLHALPQTRNQRQPPGGCRSGRRPAHQPPPALISRPGAMHRWKWRTMVALSAAGTGDTGKRLAATACREMLCQAGCSPFFSAALPCRRSRSAGRSALLGAPGCGMARAPVHPSGCRARSAAGRRCLDGAPGRRMAENMIRHPSAAAAPARLP